MVPHRPIRTGIRAIALLEASKAVLVLVSGFGLVALVHRDLNELAARLVARFHLNPSRKYARIFLDAAERVDDTKLWCLALLALIYALVRLVQAYGLWRERRWAEWLTLVAGGIYLPLEIYELFHGVTAIRLGVFAFNVVIILYIAYAMRQSS